MKMVRQTEVSSDHIWTSIITLRQFTIGEDRLNFIMVHFRRFYRWRLRLGLPVWDEGTVSWEHLAKRYSYVSGVRQDAKKPRFVPKWCSCANCPNISFSSFELTMTRQRFHGLSEREEESEYELTAKWYTLNSYFMDVLYDGRYEMPHRITMHH